MNETTTKKRNVVFIALSILFVLLSIGFIWMWLSRIPSIEGVSYPYYHLLQALVFIMMTLAFLFKKQPGWYMAVGYFLFTPLFALAFGFYQTIAYGVELELSAGAMLRDCLVFLSSRDFLLLLIYSLPVVYLLFRPKLRSQFQVELKQAFVGVLIVLTGLLLILWVIPYLLY